ncbi:MAG: pimeloyl-ACP methyl ester carboxylesterase [Gammaproteobacteria bacterium]
MAVPSARIEDLDIHFDHFEPTDRANAQRVIYVHGTGCNARVFKSHLTKLSIGHEIVALDLPGHGKSSGSGFRSAVDHAFYVGALVEHLGWDSCIVAGHSLGGGIALASAVYFPKIVSGLILIDTGARLRVSPKVIEFARRNALRGGSTDIDSRFGYARSTPQSIVDSVNAINAGCDVKVIYKDWIADDSFDFMNRLRDIEVPALAICGEEDPLTPLKYHEYLRDNLAHCDLVTIRGAGHWPFVEQPLEFNEAVLKFLNRF